MNRIVRISTTSLATLEDTSPPFNLRHPDPADTLDLGLSLLEAAGQQGSDLAILPETFTAAGLPAEEIRMVAEPLDGPSVASVADLARRHSMYVVAGFYIAEGTDVSNRAVLFDRAGQIVGTYSKQHPTEGEVANGVLPGGRTGVFETDLGHLGLAICFDLNWQPVWADLKAHGAELVCWISAYEGGLPLQAFAWIYQYPIVTSVWPYHARIIERTGRIVTETSRWSRLALYDLNLDKRLFHMNGHERQLLKMQARYGSRIRIESFTDEHVFTLESIDPELPVDEIIRDFGLVEYGTFIHRCTDVQVAARSRVPAPVG
jgi:predicted amidohydrolase